MQNDDYNRPTPHTEPLDGQVIHTIFEMAANGTAVSEITEWLNNKLPSLKDTRWDETTVRRILDDSPRNTEPTP